MRWLQNHHCCHLPRHFALLIARTTRRRLPAHHLTHPDNKATAQSELPGSCRGSSTKMATASSCGSQAVTRGSLGEGDMSPFPSRKALLSTMGLLGSLTAILPAVNQAAPWQAGQTPAGNKIQRWKPPSCPTPLRATVPGNQLGGRHPTS